MPSVHLCCLVKCRNSSRRTRVPDAKYFRIPKSEHVGRKWQEWIENQNFPVTKTLKHPTLCSEHFPSSSILPTGKLLSGTVPSIGEKSSAPCVDPTASTQGDCITLSQLLETCSPVSALDSSKDVFSASLTSSFKENISQMANARTPECASKSNQSSASKSHEQALHNSSDMSTSRASPCEPMATDCVQGASASPAPMEQDGNLCADFLKTPTKKTRLRSKRFVGDLSPSDFSSPRKAAKSLQIVRSSNLILRKKLKLERNRRYRLESKIKSLQELVQHLKDEKKYIDERVADELERALPGAGSKIFERAVKARRGSFCPELREFALTLHYYSSSGYNYVRKAFLKCLPHERTLVKWYVHVDAEPGFTKCALDSIQKMAADMKEQNKKLVVAICMDEMHIKVMTEKVQDKVFGYPDLGFHEVPEGGPLASKALVIMATAVNGSWKIPLGYFFVHSLDGKQRSSLMRNCINLVLDAGAEIASLTFDGDPSNTCAATLLGASLDPFGDWRPFLVFKRKCNGVVIEHKIDVLLDACHMVKLIRNVFSDQQTKLYDKFGNEIEWKYLELLNNFQLQEGLSAANKLKTRHIRFFNEKQKVKLAVQLLSRSVGTALHFLEFDLKIPQFSGAKATADFILMINDVFDVLNSRSMYGLGLKCAASARNIDEIRTFISEAESYIRGISADLYHTKTGRWDSHESVLTSRKKTGFLGALMCLSAVISMYDRFVSTSVLCFVPTYKCSQDHVETFFSAVRQRGGWRNNPSARQFCSAYKRLLVHVQLDANKRGNCWPLELTTILTVSSVSRITDCEVSVPLYGEECNDDDDNVIDFDVLQLSDYITDVVGYISGFVSRSVAKTNHCACCCEALFGEETQSKLIIAKDQGGLITPSQDVVLICRAVEKQVRALKADNRLIRTSLAVVQRNVKHVILDSAVFQCLDMHTFEQSFLDNHKDVLINAIIKKYFMLRVNFECTKLTDDVTGERIRTRNNKLVLFKNQ